MKITPLLAVVLAIIPSLVTAAAGFYKVRLQSETLNREILSQEICLTQEGKWYGVSYPGWSGIWFEKGNDLHLQGNFEFQLVNGNDAIELTRILPHLYTGYWQEWMDDGSYSNFITVKFERVAHRCPDTAAAPISGAGEPVRPHGPPAMK